MRRCLTDVDILDCFNFVNATGQMVLFFFVFVCCEFICVSCAVAVVFVFVVVIFVVVGQASLSLEVGEAANIT